VGDIPKFLDVVPQQWAGLLDAMERLAPLDRYQHWDELQGEQETGGVSHEAWWAALKLVRLARIRHWGPKDGGSFGYAVTRELEELLHVLDRAPLEEVAGIGLADRLAAGARLREAVASAGLAGSPTGLEAGREMLRGGRPPASVGERMVCNLFEALQQVRELGERPLTREAVQELHRRITDGTLELSGAAGRLRRAGEPAGGIDPAGRGDCQPPPAAELPERLDQMCAFANGSPADPFVHPVIRAIALHFWLAHDRPFVDGNGRTARALFYWALWRRGYAVFSFVALSPVLLAAPDRYLRAFREAETDDNDATYFILQQAEAIRAGLRAARERLTRKQGELQDGLHRWPQFQGINERQQALIGRALRAPDTRFGIARHQHSHGVTHQTARDDLFALVRRDLLTVTRERRVYVFRPATDLAARLRTAAGRRRGPRSIAADEALPTALL
jgi:Fic family protein